MKVLMQKLGEHIRIVYDYEIGHVEIIEYIVLGKLLIYLIMKVKKY